VDAEREPESGRIGILKQMQMTFIGSKAKIHHYYKSTDTAPAKNTHRRAITAQIFRCSISKYNRQHTDETIGNYFSPFQKQHASHRATPPSRSWWRTDTHSCSVHWINMHHNEKSVEVRVRHGHQ
jgi:hypothetical protein